MKSYKDFLKPEERTKLIILHKAEASSRYADRIKVILWLDQGLTFKEISALLFINEQSARNYLERYQTGGTDSLMNDNYSGYSGKLTDKQEIELTKHIKENVYLDVKPIIAYIDSIYHVNTLQVESEVCFTDLALYIKRLLGFQVKQIEKSRKIS